MTDGEKMVWAARFADRVYVMGGCSQKARDKQLKRACQEAHFIVMEMRRLAENNSFDNDDPCLEMLLEMTAGAP